jgi:hypothetical protein
MLGINNSMAKQKKYMTLAEAYLSRYQRGGFQVGDVFKFNDKFKSLDCYKSLGQNVKDMIDQMIETGLHVRVVGIRDSGMPRYPGNPQTSSNDVELSLALDNGGGRYTHYINLSPEMGQPEPSYPNLPPIPDAVVRKSKVNIKPEELEDIDSTTNKTDRGTGVYMDTERSLPTQNTQIPSTPVTPSMEVNSYTKEYMNELQKY